MNKRELQVMGLKEEYLEEYIERHKNVWPEIQECFKKANFGNMSVCIQQFDDGKHYIISYKEYTGTNRDADMKILEENEFVEKWGKIFNPMFVPLKNNKDKKSTWTSCQEVFYLA